MSVMDWSPATSSHKSSRDAARGRKKGQFWAQVDERPTLVVSGSTLTLAAAPGATTLTVADAADFDADGGTLRIRLSETGDPDAAPLDDLIVDYLGWDGDYDDVPDDVIELAAPLPTPMLAPGPVGCPVDVWDPSRDAPAQEWVMGVIPDDSETGKSLPVTIDPGDVDGLPTGTLPGKGEAVLVGPDSDDGDEDDLVLIRVRGSKPVRDGSFLDKDTVPIPPGVVVDPDAPPETPPLVEAFGGIGSILLRVLETTVATDKIDLWVSTTTPVDTDREPDDTMLGVSRASHGIFEVEGVKVVAGTIYYVVAKARNVKGSSDATPELAVSPREATSEDVAVDLITTDMLLFNNAIGVALDLADLYAVRITGARIRTAIAGARCEVFVDENGRGRIRFFDDLDNVIGAIQAISEGGVQRFTVGSGGPNGARSRWWIDTFGNRYADVICDVFNVFGLIQGTNGLTLQLSPTVMKGFDGQSNRELTLPADGQVTLAHTVAGGGITSCGLRGGNAHLFSVHVDNVTGSTITFGFRRRSDNNPPDAGTVVRLDWSITALER